MLKVIRVSRTGIKIKRTDKNNIYYVDNDLAIELGFQTRFNMTRKKMFRNYIIEKSEKDNTNKSPKYPISRRDIKRIENPGKMEIPVNIVDILETIILTITDKEGVKLSYRAPEDNDQIVSEFLLEKTLLLLEQFYCLLNDEDEESHPEREKYRESIIYVKNRLEEFDSKYGFSFNEFFKTKEDL